MTKPIPLPSRQVTALCKGAAKAGFVAEVKIGDVIVRLVPEDHSELKETVDAKKRGYL
ncbi:hypothetical protein AB4Y96_09015 [Phyllobacterium sp. TAF24]|uniref:hypothetical protein n=1 Tax=Phyllobacterium sp. TAF24 TaxID=3233068 RepID=UPI003F9552A2